MRKRSVAIISPRPWAFEPQVIWFVYIVRCRDGSLYTGITNDLDARIAAHNLGKGAKYTRSRRPVTVVWTRRIRGKGPALRLEHRVKQFSRSEKDAFIGSTSAQAQRSTSSATRKRSPSKRSPSRSKREKGEGLR